MQRGVRPLLFPSSPSLVSSGSASFSRALASSLALSFVTLVFLLSSRGFTKEEGGDVAVIPPPGVGG